MINVVFFISLHQGDLKKINCLYLMNDFNICYPSESTCYQSNGFYCHKQILNVFYVLLNQRSVA